MGTRCELQILNTLENETDFWAMSQNIHLRANERKDKRYFIKHKKLSKLFYDKKGLHTYITVVAYKIEFVF